MTEEKLKQDVANLKQIVFECSICKKIYKDPGICSTCDVALKKKGS